MGGHPRTNTYTGEEIFSRVTLPPNMSLAFHKMAGCDDSTNITYPMRAKLADTIAAMYDDFDAFIILHGTDTLAETCAYLTMTWQRLLQKTVLVVGSQRTPDHPRSDVPAQLGNALRFIQYAVSQHIAGVYTLCQQRVLCGARVVKVSSKHLKAFTTPGLRPAAYIGTEVRPTPTARYQHTPLRGAPLPPAIHLVQRISTYAAKADQPADAFIHAAQNGLIEGAILLGRGSGNIPSVAWKDGEPSWYDAIRIVGRLPHPVISAIQTEFAGEDADLTAYAPGAMAHKAGAVSLRNLTPAMADVKFRMALQMHRNPFAVQAFIDKPQMNELG